MTRSQPLPGGAAARAQVGRAIQKLAAARLGRAFIPLAILLVLGVAQIAFRRGGILLAGGAALSAVSMLAFGLQVVNRAFGRGSRVWMAAATAAGLVPAAYALWVLGWLGLRGVATAGGLFNGVWAALHLLLGILLVWRWLQILELSRLAATMALSLPGDEADER